MFDKNKSTSTDSLDSNYPEEGELDDERIPCRFYEFAVLWNKR